MTDSKKPAARLAAPQIRHGRTMAGSEQASRRSTGIKKKAFLQVKTETKSHKAELFARLVAENPLSGIKAVSAIRSGYPADILKSAGYFFNVPDARIYVIAQVPPSTASRLQKNHAKIDSAATERIYRMSAVARMAIGIFEDQDTAIAWMRQPNHTLGNMAPLDLMDTEPGAATVRQVLNAIATGGVA